MIKINASVGELLDKISILKIKEEKINDEKKLLNIKKELGLLSSIAEKFIEKDEKSYKKFMDELFEINLQLWETEDSIRILENKKNFNDEFIQLARNVYYSNDKRFEIKSKINNFYGSEIVEEKDYEDYS
tara:strand:- start:1495 stop:1884 length:390 start_codon:yes stop_codon:yes gene_type:complete